MNILKKSIVLLAFVEGSSYALSIENLKKNEDMLVQLNRRSHHHHKKEKNVRTYDNYDNDPETVSRYDHMEIHKKFDWFPPAQKQEEIALGLKQEQDSDDEENFKSFS